METLGDCRLLFQFPGCVTIKLCSRVKGKISEQFGNITFICNSEVKIKQLYGTGTEF